MMMLRVSHTHDIVGALEWRNCFSISMCSNSTSFGFTCLSCCDLRPVVGATQQKAGAIFTTHGSTKRLLTSGG